MAQLRRTGISRSSGIRPEARIRKGIGNMDGQNNGKSGYDDIINLPHHVSSCHPQMSMKERAAQFSPFAALTGYGEVIRETGRLTDQMLEFSEEERAELDHKLQIASSFPGGNPEIRITYFVPDQKKDGGAWATLEGKIKRVDAYAKQVVMESGSVINIDCIVEICSI